MRWRGCIKRLNANEGRFCTTIGLPISSLRGTIIKSNSVSTTNAGNKETWQQKNVKRQHGAQHRAKKRAEQRLPAGLGTLFAGLLLVVLAFVEGDSAWKALHDVLFGLFGCGSFVLGAAVCCLAVQYTRGKTFCQDLQAGSGAGVCLRHGDRFFRYPAAGHVGIPDDSCLLRKRRECMDRRRCVGRTAGRQPAAAVRTLRHHLS